jgi:hypothetical protein
MTDGPAHPRECAGAVALRRDTRKTHARRGNDVGETEDDGVGVVDDCPVVGEAADVRDRIVEERSAHAAERGENGEHIADRSSRMDLDKNADGSVEI